MGLSQALHAARYVQENCMHKISGVLFVGCCNIILTIPTTYVHEECVSSRAKASRM